MKAADDADLCKLCTDEDALAELRELAARRRRYDQEVAALAEGAGSRACMIVDTREQIPWWLAAPETYPNCELGTLPSGDYSLEGWEEQVCVERKTLADLFGSCASGRDRFEAEWERMSHLDYAVVVVEASFVDVTRGYYRSKMSPKAVIATLQAWSIRYGVHVHFAGRRGLAERWAYRLLQKFWAEQQKMALRGVR